MALALHHNGDAGISFVATVPKARRKGLATTVMRQALQEAAKQGCTTTTLQATDVGEKLYTNLGLPPSVRDAAVGAAGLDLRPHYPR